MRDCSNEKYREMLFAYELGMLDETAREELEIHLLECEECNKEAQQLTRASDILRHDPNIRETISSLADERDESGAEKIRAAKEPSISRFFKSNVSSLALVAVVIIVLIIKPWDIEIRSSLEAFAARNSIVVMHFEDLTGGEDSSQLGEIAANLLITDLSESQYLRVVSGQHLNDILKHIDTTIQENEVLVQIGLETDARWAVMGSILRTEPTVILTSQLINIETGHVEASRRIEGNEGQDIFATVDDLARGVKDDLNLPAIVDEEPDIQVADITTHSSEAYRHYLDGIRKRSAFYLPEADASFRRALEYDSTFAMVYYYLSLPALGAERSEFVSKAVEYSENASRREKYFIRSREAFINGKVDHSIEILEELVRNYADEKEAHFYLGRYEQARGNDGKAVVHLNKAIEIDPWYKDAYNDLAYLYNRVDLFTEAIEVANRYVDVAPNEPNPFDTKGEIFLSKCKYDSAIVALQKAVEIRPDYYFSWATLAHTYFVKRDYPMAQECIKRLSGSDNLQHILMNQLGEANILFRQGKLDSAIYYLDSLINTNKPEGADDNGLRVLEYAHFLKATVYEEKGNYQSALRALDASHQVAVLRNPDSRRPNDSYKVKLLAKMGEFSKATQCADEIKKALEESGRELHRYWHAVGQIHFEKRQYKEAMTDFSKVAHGLGFNSRNMLAISSLEYGEYESAIAYYDDLITDYAYWTITGNIARVKMHYFLGRAYEESRWHSKAIKEYQYFVDLWENGDSDLETLSDARKRLQLLKKSTKN